jgi:hypothetical protein
MNTRGLARRGKKVGKDCKYPNILMISSNMKENSMKINLKGMAST